MRHVAGTKVERLERAGQSVCGVISPREVDRGCRGGRQEKASALYPSVLASTAIRTSHVRHISPMHNKFRSSRIKGKHSAPHFRSCFSDGVPCMWTWEKLGANGLRQVWGQIVDLFAQCLHDNYTNLEYSRTWIEKSSTRIWKLTQSSKLPQKYENILENIFHVKNHIPTKSSWSSFQNFPETNYPSFPETSSTFFFPRAKYSRSPRVHGRWDTAHFLKSSHLQLKARTLLYDFVLSARLFLQIQITRAFFAVVDKSAPPGEEGGKSVRGGE